MTQGEKSQNNDVPGNHERQNTHLVKCTLEPSFALRTIVPFLIDNAKGDIFIRGSSHESDQTSVLFASLCKGLPSLPTILTLNAVRGSLGLINEVGVEDVELVTLHNLRGRVVMVIMGLIVLVPLVAHLNTVKVPWLSGTVLTSPLGL
jgi:hypothetical protein